MPHLAANLFDRCSHFRLLHCESNLLFRVLASLHGTPSLQESKSCRIFPLPIGTKSWVRVVVTYDVSDYTAQINVELKVGAISETITVTGETPVVDVQSARREMTLQNDILKAIPTARSYGAMVTVVPGVNTNLNDVVTFLATDLTISFGLH